MAGFMPAIHVFDSIILKTWMAATSAAMTREICAHGIGRDDPPMVGRGG
jgi:hypothetical protein